jgi:hypothetical protein
MVKDLHKSLCVQKNSAERRIFLGEFLRGILFKRPMWPNYMQLHMVTAERFFEFLSGILFAPPNIAKPMLADHLQEGLSQFGSEFKKSAIKLGSELSTHWPDRVERLSD